MLKTIRTYFHSDEMAEGRPFYLIITILLLVMTLLALFGAPATMSVGRMLLFTALMVLHLTLHWLSGNAVAHTGWGTVYLLVQGLLALALVLVAQRPSLVLALYAALIAETLGLFGLTRLAVGGVVGYLLLTGIGYLLLGGWTLMAEWLSPTISTMALLIIFMVLYRRQMDARSHSQELLKELETTHHQLADYAAQVESLTLAAERQRMARELHDTLAQGVAGLVLLLEAANANLTNGNVPRAQTIVQQSMQRARNTLAQARAAIDDLRLEDRSLAEAVQQQTDRFTQATGIPCHLALELSSTEFIEGAVADHAERITGECLTNITRHAQATNVWLELRQTDQLLTIDVRDDGVGFDVEKAARTGHYGLLGMRERTRLVNGRFEIDSQVGQGTHLTVTLPLEVA